MRAIAPSRTAAYSGAMPRLLRLLLLLAFVLMPVGILPAGHAAEATAAVAMAHCADTPDQAPAGSSHHPADRAADCAMACSALPSVAGTLAAPVPVAVMLDPPPPASGRGIAPEAATPPPRRS